MDSKKNLTQGFSKSTVLKTHLEILGYTPRNFGDMRWGLNKYLTLMQLTHAPHSKQF